MKTLPRCHSTVRALRNDWAPISGWSARPCASRATDASCAVSAARVSSGRLGSVSPGGQELAAGALGERLGAHSGQHLIRGPQLGRGRPFGGLRGAAIRRRADGRGRAPAGAGSGSAGRWLRDKGRRRPAPSVSRARDRAAMPRPKSVPQAAAVSASRSSASRGGRGRFRCVRRPRSVRAAPTWRRTAGGVLAGKLRCRQRVGVTAEAVVEDRGQAAARSSTACPDPRQCLRRWWTQSARWPRLPCRTGKRATRQQTAGSRFRSLPETTSGLSDQRGPSRKVASSV